MLKALLESDFHPNSPRINPAAPYWTRQQSYSVALVGSCQFGSKKFVSRKRNWTLI